MPNAVTSRRDPQSCPIVQRQVGFVLPGDPPDALARTPAAAHVNPATSQCAWPDRVPCAPTEETHIRRLLFRYGALECASFSSAASTNATGSAQNSCISR